MLEGKGAVALKEKLIVDGEWDPFAFITACEGAAKPSGSTQQKELMRELQEVESLALLDWICSNQP